ncbi:hypothetical protein SEPCBS119000_005177 [Sporothrix epigloea]|uniref:Methyltransferase domain-containing protein n=1 Tax=Sporothrix epigloea TaxID=1892477 RepID=A0ABP0DWD2_9PEZI
MAHYSQTAASQHMYAERAGRYNDSWHPQYAERLARIVNAHPGQRILDLCCGTGLELFLLAEALNKDGGSTDNGVVVGVDVTAEMLAVAADRRSARPELADRVTLLRHDVTQLEKLATENSSSPLRKGSFDTIVCSNAFVLFDDPNAVVASWRSFLKPPVHAPTRPHLDESCSSHRGQENHCSSTHHREPGGKLVVDIPHEAAQRAGLTMERVARRMGLRFPSNRSWVTSVDSMRNLLERNGYHVDHVVELDHVSGRGATRITSDHVDGLYESMTKSPAFAAMVAGAGPGVETATIIRHGRPIFHEEFLKAADRDGRVYESDTMYVYVARLA